MGETGVLTEDDRVELLEGLIVPKINRRPVHDAVVDIVRDTLDAELPSGWRIRGQSAITTSDSEPEPDIAVVRGKARDYISHHPGPSEIAMVVEVAETSLDRDRNKRRLYARAAIAHYWIINLDGNVVEVYSKPSSKSDPKYAEELVFGVDDLVPLVIASQQVADIPARDLLP